MTDAGWSASGVELFDRVGGVLDGDGRGVLATVVSVEGSAYRRPGAKMFVPEGGGGVGQVTAGCLEDEVERLAGEVLASGEPRVETYDLMPERDDDVWGLGVGCNGIVDVLLEPVDGALAPVREAVAAGEDVGILTVVGAADEDGDDSGPGVDEDDGDSNAPIGARAYYDPATDAVTVPDHPRGEAFPADLPDGVREAAADLVARDRAGTVEAGGLTVLVDGVAAPDDLVVVGSGNDLRPVVGLAARVGFRVTVVGFRGAAADEDRFPAADAVLSTSPADLRGAFDFDGDTYAVVATHNFLDDRIALDELLETPVPYVGLMGPRERFEEILDDFEAEGRSLSEADFERIYTPVGLDLGGDSPDDIALSIVAEVQAVSEGREPDHLRNREGPIHERLDLG